MFITAPLNQTALQPLFNYLEQFHPLSENFRRHHEQACELIVVKKGKFVLSPLDPDDHLFFLVKGAVRVFVKEGKKDISTCFSFEDEFIQAMKNPHHSLNYSSEYLQAIEDCELIRIPYTLIHLLNKAYPEASVISSKLLSLQHYAACERSILARFPTALGRYLRYASVESNISRIPQRYLASYLGMRVETLSRIKNKLCPGQLLKIA